MPLAPAYPWLEAIVSFTEFTEPSRFAVTLRQGEAVISKRVFVYSWPYPQWLKPLQRYFREAEHAVHVMVANDYREAFDWVVNESGGTVGWLHVRKSVPTLVGNLAL
jgi:hypothetical protein